ncbi:cuticle protein 16.5 [Drosophila sulfurigaster albostrigata]|uniref:Cuticle protein 16.5 n=1 Tax=Drosophila albomicans TaxID=7291 RepID=A0A6P8X4N8_DROAB|nr:cuticle protein 16.5 [Drosophila albomicans]XP_060655250.1 cuticle protein 16.5 [Drosophila nasuta]XP_062132925.1 cuticle protein 16.5 [Drosophila sulfurigaster albostrigata]
MFKYFVLAFCCLASAAAAPGYLGGLAAPALPLAAAPAISYGHALAAPSIASYGLAPRLSYAAPALAHAPLAAPAYSSYGLAPRISYAAPAIAHAAPLGLAHAPLGLGYRSYAAPALSLGHGW